MGRPVWSDRPAPGQAPDRQAGAQYGSRHRNRPWNRLPLKRWNGLSLGLWLGLAVGVLIWFGAFERLELLGLDARFFLRELLTAGAAPEVVIVAIDDESLKKFGQWPWPRALHAQLLDHLREAGARAVGFDLLFDEPSRDAGGDREMAAAISRAENVVLPVNMQLVARRKPGWLRSPSGRTEALSVSRAEKPVPLLAGASRGLGHIEVIPDPDGVVRRLPWQAGEYAPFAAELAAVARAPSSPRTSLTPGVPLRPAFPPVDANGYMLIDFRLAGGLAGAPSGAPAASVLSAERMFPAVPYWKVLEGRVAPGFFKSKVVLVGVTARGLETDYHITSLTALGYIPGVYIQASAVRTLAGSNFIRRWPGRPLPTAAVAVLWSCILGLLFTRWRPLPGAAGIFVLAGAVVVAAVYLFNRYGVWVEAAGPLLAPIPLIYVAALARRYLYTDLEKRRLREQFSRYVSPQAAAEILAHPEGLALAGQKRQVTILFADIRGFTGYAEKAEPTEVVALLNRYLDRMTSGVLANRGCLDKFIGDAVMAVFGAPVPGDDHALEALKAALAMREEIRRLREELAAEGRTPLEIGIGIHTGEAVVGNVGSQTRTEYTAVGDAVNVAARLEGQAGPGQILVSEATRRLLPAAFAEGLAFEPLGPVAIKGKALPVEVYALR